MLLRLIDDREKKKEEKKNYNTCKKSPVKISRPKNEKGMGQCGQ